MHLIGSTEDRERGCNETTSCNGNTQMVCPMQVARDKTTALCQWSQIAKLPQSQWSKTEELPHEKGHRVTVHASGHRRRKCPMPVVTNRECRMPVVTE